MTLSEPPLAIDPYRWLRNGLGIASLLLLEASWTAPWMATYFAACDRLTVGWWLMFLFLSGGLAVVLSRLQRARVREAVRRQAYGMAALGLWLGLTLAATSSLVCPPVPPTAGTRELALTLLQVPSQAALLLAVYWTWREAVPLGSTDGLNPSSATSRLQRALLGLAAYLLVFQPGLSPQLVGSISLTVANGLIGVGLGRASYLGQVRAAARLPFRGRWLLTLLAVCGGVLAVAAYCSEPGWCTRGCSGLQARL